MLTGEPLSGGEEGGRPTNFTLFIVKIPGAFKPFPISESVLQTEDSSQTKRIAGRPLFDFFLVPIVDLVEQRKKLKLFSEKYQSHLEELRKFCKTVP